MSQITSSMLNCVEVMLIYTLVLEYLEYFILLTEHSGRIYRYSEQIFFNSQLADNIPRTVVFIFASIALGDNTQNCIQRKSTQQYILSQWYINISTFWGNEDVIQDQTFEEGQCWKKFMKWSFLAFQTNTISLNPYFCKLSGPLFKAFCY